MGGKISVLAVVNGGSDELAKGIAMSIAANNPRYLSQDDIPAEEIEKETKIQLEKAEKQSKKLKFCVTVTSVSTVIETAVIILMLIL